MSITIRHEDWSQPADVAGSKSARQSAPTIIARSARQDAPAASERLMDIPRSQRPLSSGRCLHEIFEQQVDVSPCAIALECGERAWTYAEVEAEANRLARHLCDQGVGSDTFVGITMDRSEWPIIAILAVLKSGGAYVPLEPSLPDDRLRYIAEAASLSAVITQAGHAARVRHLVRSTIVTIERYRDLAASYNPQRPSSNERHVRPDDICYVLFTSGTTGRPKGVVAEHRNVVRFVEAFNEVCDTGPADRVLQGFALGFDGSVEEIWMAFSNGATLVCGDATTPRFGPDLAAFLENHRISFLSTVPTLLSTLPSSVGSLRQLVVSGEACHIDLVNRWCRPGLTMLNVYGPTEATVNTTACVLQKGKPVTIGQPLSCYEIYVLDDQLRPVPQGEKGELYVGGPTLARGYLNQSDLTSAAFIDWTPPPGDPISGGSRRVYKTGDLVRWNHEGELEFFGRIDSQVKLRGFRIELSEIEAVLVEQRNIALATVAVHEDGSGEKCLAAYVSKVDGAEAIDRDEILATLRQRLPAYMIPSYLDVLPYFPRVPSGKVDRKQLPQPQCPLIACSEAPQEKLSPQEARVADVWAKLLKLPRVGLDQNFFTDLNGHSLLAAQLVRALRDDLGASIPVRDVYAHPTVRQLAARMADLVADERQTTHLKSASSVTARQPIAPRRPWATIAMQFLYLLAVMPILALPLVWVLPVAMDVLQKRASILDLITLTIGVAIATWASAIVVAIAAKWLIIGRYKPGRYPLWGSYYLRWWIVSRLQHLSGLSALNGTPMACILWRAMGAKVGRQCMIDAALVYAWDCIRLGDDVSIGADTQLPGMRIEAGELVIGSIAIGNRCFVGAHSVLGLDVEMGADAHLDDQSLLPDGTKLPPGTSWRGSPAQVAEIVLPSGAPVQRGWFWTTLFAVVQLTLGFAIGLATLMPVIVSAGLTAALVVHYPASMSIPAFLAIVPMTMIAFAFWSAACKRLIHPNPRPGIWKIYSIKHLQHWLSGLVMQIVKTVGMSIFTTVYLPPWMRLLGARLGRHTEMSTVWRLDPDMLTAGDGVFFADGSMVPGSRIYLGRLVIAHSRIGDRSFLGNSAMLSPGQNVGDDCLLGVLSAPPLAAEGVPEGTDWLGSPGFRLPNREKVQSFDASVTYAPSRRLYAQRAVIDGLRVLLPGYVLGGVGIASLLVVMAVYKQYGVWGAYTAVPLLSWLGLAVCLTTVVGLKWLIMGRFKPVVVPLWSRYVWWNELINGLYESLMAPIISNFFGTPVAAAMLRLMGCKIGRNCYIETALFSEFDLVEIGDHVALNAGAIVQNHLFEDRVMKSSSLRIGDGCTVGNMSVILYDAVMEPQAILNPMSLLMKGERMPAAEVWQGIPTVRAG